MEGNPEKSDFVRADALCAAKSPVKQPWCCSEGDGEPPVTGVMGSLQPE